MSEQQPKKVKTKKRKYDEMMKGFEATADPFAYTHEEKKDLDDLYNKGGRRTRGKKRTRKRHRSRRKSRRRKGGGTRRNSMPEKPKVGYNYRINIYYGGQGERALRYGNVIGTYMGLAEEFHDSWSSVDKKKFYFKTQIEDEDGNNEWIGEIVSLIGPPHINVDGGRRKKRTRRRKSMRRKKRRKKRTKRRR